MHFNQSPNECFSIVFTSTKHPTPFKRPLSISLRVQGMKLTYFFGSHLASRYFKVVANSKKLVVIMKHTQTIFTLSLGRHCTRETKLVIDISCCQNIRSSYKKDTTMCHIQRERSPKSKMASRDNDRFTFKIVHMLHFRNRLNEELCCRLICIRCNFTPCRMLFNRD